MTFLRIVIPLYLFLFEHDSFGKPVPTFPDHAPAIELSALGQSSVFVNGGRRGLQIELDPHDAVKVVGAIAQGLTA